MEKQNALAIRKLDELGRIVLPIEVRRALDWNEKSAVEIWINPATNEVVLKTHIYACTYCGETENLKEFNKRRICPACQSAFAKL